ncbi:hypothetical protein CN514_18085, partial [Bacillus sp. AFS001701]
FPLKNYYESFIKKEIDVIIISGDSMIKKGICLFCLRVTDVAPLYSWDVKGRTNYYCQDHYFEVKTFHNKQKREFIKAFENDNDRKNLSKENLELYNRLTKNHPATKQ